MARIRTSSENVDKAAMASSTGTAMVSVLQNIYTICNYKIIIIIGRNKTKNWHKNGE